MRVSRRLQDIEVRVIPEAGDYFPMRGARLYVLDELQNVRAHPKFHLDVKRDSFFAYALVGVNAPSLVLQIDLAR